MLSFVLYAGGGTIGSQTVQLVQTVSRAGAGALRGGHQMVITSAGAGTGGLQLLSGAGSGANLLVGGSTGTPNLLVQSGTSANLQIVQPGQVNPIVGQSTKLFLSHLFINDSFIMYW